MNRTIKVASITFASFAIYYFLSIQYFGAIRGTINSTLPVFPLSHILTYLLVGMPLAGGTLLIAGRKRFWGALGLSNSFQNGFGLGLLFTAPMFIGYAMLFDFNTNLTISTFVLGAVSAGFFEELYFRAFLFGMVYRFTRIGFIPAIFLGALLFATGHLHQSREISVLIGVFLTTTMGAILFAWLYCEWKYNLWVVIFMHALMNLAWMLFAVSTNALGGQGANIFRLLTIALAIIFTLTYKRRNGLKMEITRATIWLKPPPDAHAHSIGAIQQTP